MPGGMSTTCPAAERGLHRLSHPLRTPSPPPWSPRDGLGTLHPPRARSCHGSSQASTRGGTRVYFCTVATAPAPLRARTRASSWCPPTPAVPRVPEPQASGWRSRGLRQRGLRQRGAGGSAGSVLGLRREQSLQEREQVRRELLGGGRGWVRR